MPELLEVRFITTDGLEFTIPHSHITRLTIIGGESAEVELRLRAPDGFWSAPVQAPELESGTPLLPSHAAGIDSLT
jgi:hypothetical protein